MNYENASNRRNRTGVLKKSATHSLIIREVKNAKSFNEKASELASIKQRLKKWNKGKENCKLFQSYQFPNKSKPIEEQPELEQTDGQQVLQFRMDEFEVGDLLGRGASATVKFAIHKPTGGIYSIKTLQREKIESNLKRFIQGLKIQMFLDHPNIAKIYGICLTQKEVHILMELCIDGTLAENLYDCRNPIQKGIGMMRGVTKGLKHVHDRKVHHRDLKLENILVNYGVPKITDFQLSVYSKLQFLPRNTICGSPLYFSPEMISTSKYTKKADIWSLGIIFYEVFCGYFPFEITDLSKIPHQEIKSPPNDLNPEILTLIHGLLEKDLKKRMSLEQILSSRVMKGE